MKLKLGLFFSFLFLLSILTACKKDNEYELGEYEALIPLDYKDERYVNDPTIRTFDMELGHLILSEDKTTYLISLSDPGRYPEPLVLIPIRLPDVQNLSKVIGATSDTLSSCSIRFSGELKEKKEGQSSYPVVLTTAIIGYLIECSRLN